MNLLLAQIHQYMLSKAPPVPQLSPTQDSEEHLTNKEGEAQGSLQEEAAVAAPPSNPAAGENPAVGDRIIEEVVEAPVNVNPGSTGVTASTETPAGDSSNRLLHRPETRVQKPADDRLFTWAAVGLTIAIMVLLLKKFMKSSGHGTVFMDGGS